MAFTDSQKAQIRHYLGYPDVYRGSNLRLESAIDVVGGRTEAQAMVEPILTSIAAAIVRLNPDSATTLITAGGIKKVDEVEFFATADGSSPSIGEMRKQGRSLVGRLSILLGVPVAHDIFGTSGYSDDSWGSSANQLGRPMVLG